MKQNKKVDTGPLSRFNLASLVFNTRTVHYLLRRSCDISDIMLSWFKLA